jgi:hypothetical protein
LERIEKSVKKKGGVAAIRYDAKMGVLQEDLFPAFSQNPVALGNKSSHVTPSKAGGVPQHSNQLSSIHLSQHPEDQPLK